MQLQKLVTFGIFQSVFILHLENITVNNAFYF